MKKKTKCCEITVWSGMTELFRTEIPIGCITDQQLKDLLRCLVSKAGLSFQEICDSCVKRNTRRYVSHLEVTSECSKARTIFSCGGNPTAVALVKHQAAEKHKGKT